MSKNEEGGGIREPERDVRDVPSSKFLQVLSKSLLSVFS